MISQLEVNRRRLVKQAPKSMFRKAGPGVKHKARAWFQSLDSIDRQYVLKFGWVPQTWADLPYRKPREVLRLEKARAVAIDAARERTAPKTIVGKVWQAAKKLFGFGRRGDR